MAELDRPQQEIRVEVLPLGSYPGCSPRCDGLPSENIMSLSRYALLTAAYNEEAFIARTIEAVAAQTLPPARWIIASDGSTDRTDEIVRGYCERYSFLRLLRIEKTGARGVISKVNALRTAYTELSSVEYDFLGNVDADVSFGADYFSGLLAKFECDSKLGIAGGWICEEKNGEFQGRATNRTASVAHAAQLVRRECYEAIGGYAALKYGGEDWCAELNARMLGWRVESFPEFQVRHYRPTGAADHLLRHCYRQGKMDFSFGSHPLFEAVKCLLRAPEKPFLAGAVVRFVGFIGCYFSGEARLVPPGVSSFLRKEQKSRLRVMFGRPAVAAENDKGLQ